MTLRSINQLTLILGHPIYLRNYFFSYSSPRRLFEHPEDMFNPFRTNEIYHKGTYNKIRMVHCEYRGVTGCNFSKILYCILISEDQLWQSSRLGVYGVSGAQRARLMVQYIYVMIIILR